MTDTASRGNDRATMAKWLRLHLTDQVGPKTFARLLEYFGDIDAVLKARPGELASVPRIGRKKAEAMVAAREEVDIDKEIQRAEQLGVRIITMQCSEYPEALKQIPSPPPVLYVRGELRREDQLAIALVGSRSCSQYGRDQASRFARLLAQAGFTIVSGLARGIDTAAHMGALAAKGRTIAVQGRGLADVFPPENRHLAEDIVKHGAVISELPLDFEPLATTFPARNRIISGLSRATIVVEARHRSGALITAKLAMEQNRDVMAVPGHLGNPGSEGPHGLIKDGAKLIENIEDVMEALGYIGQTLEDHARDKAAEVDAEVEPPSLFDEQALKLTEPEAAAYGVLTSEAMHVDEVILTAELPAAQIRAALTSLQLKGLIKPLPGGYYQRK